MLDKYKDLLIPCSRGLDKLTGFQLVKKFPAFYGTRRFIPAFTSARHLSLPWATSIQSIPPHPTSWRSTFILSSHLRLGLPSGHFPSGFPTKNLYTILTHTRYMPRQSHSTRFDHPKNIGLQRIKKHKIWVTYPLPLSQNKVPCDALTSTTTGQFSSIP